MPAKLHTYHQQRYRRKNHLMVVGMSRVVHFEISADNPERAVKFYHNVFGWKITRWDGPMDYWIITTGRDKEPGINGGMIKKLSSQGAKFWCQNPLYLAAVILPGARIQRAIYSALSNPVNRSRKI